MFTSLFRKSTPLNYALVIIAVTVLFFMYQVGHVSGGVTAANVLEKFGLWFIILFSVFTANFIVKKNTLSRKSAYTVLFYVMFLVIFPSLFNNPNLLLSNFFILLALRRLVSLHSLKASKEKIFDASLWIFVAALFHFWAVLFIVLVFISIIFHAASDYRNWILPFMACAAILALFGLYAFMFDEGVFEQFLAKMQTNLSIDYFTDQSQNIALSAFAVIALYFLMAMVFTLTNRPTQLQSSYKQIVASFFIGVLIFVISPVKSNDLLVFTIAPLAFMATATIEYRPPTMKEDIIIALVIATAMFLFFLQL
jgi:hypothetical protein